MTIAPISPTLLIRLLPTLALATLLGSACGKTPRPSTPTGLDLPALRAEASASPRDLALQRALLEAEMFHEAGEPARAAAQVSVAQAAGPQDVRVWLLSALHAEAHGHTENAVEAYLRVLQIVSSGESRDPLAAHMAELAVHGLSSLEGGLPGYRDKVGSALGQTRTALPAPARWSATDLSIQLALSEDALADSVALAKGAGCLTQFTTVGPFGPHDLLEFDQTHDVPLGGPLAAHYDLGPGRGQRPTRELGALGCTVHLGGDAIAQGGVRYATTEVTVGEAGEYLLRFDSPNTAALFLDGREVLTVDRRRRPDARVRFVPLALSAGTHRLTLKVASRHPDPALRVALLEERAMDRAAVALPPATAGGLARYLRGSLQLLRGDPVGARVSLADVTVATASTYLLTQRANALFNDPLAPTDVRQDQARQLLVAALKRDGDLWNPTLQLASLASNNGREDEAIDALRTAAERFAEVPAVPLTLAQMLEGRGWHAEADKLVLAMRRQVPDACGPMLAELRGLRRRSRQAAAAELSERIMDCNAMSDARYTRLVRERNWDAAKVELERLARFSPQQSQFSWQLGRLELARRTGDADAALAHIRALREAFPRFSSGVVDAFDFHLSRGEKSQAASELEEALVAEPSATTSLWRLRSLVDQSTALSSFRRDGLEAIAAFEASGRSYSQPQVLVFDYMATRLFEDGSAIELVHTVQRAQSDEAVDELAEVEVPEGARLLKLRTVKADGRVLEPDAIAGKDTLSLPNVELGDYVEMEFLREHEPPRAFPDGYLGDRFYFSSFEVPFDHSEMVYIAPETMALTVDPRGPAPTAQTEVRDGLRVLRWVVEQSEPLVSEVGSVPPREYIPSMRLAYRTQWSQFIDSLRELLTDRNVYDPELAALAQSLVGEAAADDHRLRAQRLYDWVLDNIDNSNDTFSQAAVMLRARSGNAARVLHYLLGLAGVPSDLALVRSATADVTPSEVPDTATYDHLMVRVGGDDDPLWLFTSERHASFGFVPAQLAGQPALLLSGADKRVRLPERTATAAERELDVRVQVREGGTIDAEVREVVRGSGAITWRNQLEQAPAAELEQRFEQEYLGRLVPGAQLRSLQIAGRGREHASLTLTYAFEVTDFAQRRGTAWTLPAMMSTHLAANYARLSKRTTTMLVASPLSVDVTYRISFPKGAARPGVPTPLSLRGPEGRAEFSQTAAYRGETLEMKRKIRIPIMRVGAGRYTDFARFCREVDRQEATEFAYRLTP